MMNNQEINAASASEIKARMKANVAERMDLLNAWKGTLQEQFRLDRLTYEYESLRAAKAGETVKVA